MSGKANVSVHFDGVDQLLKSFDLSEKQIATAGADAMRKTVQKAQKQARDTAAVRTGYMRDHVQINEVSGNGKTITGEFESKAPYSSFVEFGTYKQRSQPFVRPAMTDATPYFYKTFQAALEAASK